MDQDAPNPTKHRRNQQLINFEEILLIIENANNGDLDPEDLILWLSNMTQGNNYKFDIMEGDSPKSQLLGYIMNMQALLNERDKLILEKDEQIERQDELILKKDEQIERRDELILKKEEELKILIIENKKQSRELEEMRKRIGLQEEENSQANNF